MSTKTIKSGLSKANVNAIAGAIGTATLNRLVPQFSTSVAYTKGQYTNYNNQLYRFTADKSAGAWDSTKVESASLNDLINDVNDAVASVNSKANVDGNYPTMTVGLADNLTPHSEDSGAEQEQPFISQGTGCGNGTEIVTTGDYALLREKQGHTLVVSQLLKELASGNWGFSGATGSFSDGVVTFTASAQNGRMYNSANNRPNLISGHKYLAINVVKLTTATTSVFFSYDISPTKSAYTVATTDKQLVCLLFSPSQDVSNAVIRIGDERSSNWDAISIYGSYVIDITEWEADVIADLTAHPENFFRYYNGSLTYNTGSLESSNGRYLVATGRNIYNPNETYNVVVPNKSFFASKTTTITYYDKDKNVISTENVSAGNTFTTPSNCAFINSSVSDITITPYYTDQEGGEGYLDNNNVPIEYPHEEPTIVDTGSETLLSSGNAHDYKTPDGTIYRLVDAETLDADKAVGATITISGIKADTTNVVSKYGALSEWGTISGTTITLTKALSNGDKIYFEKANPTTEQGTTFPENIKINDYGIMYWLDSSNNLVSIPQGNKLFYHVNYKGFVDDVYSRTEGDATKLVIQSELSDKFEAYLKSLSGYDATATQVLKNVEGTLTWVTEE